MATIASGSKVETYLGAKAESLLGFKSRKFQKNAYTCRGPSLSTKFTPHRTVTFAC